MSDELRELLLEEAQRIEAPLGDLPMTMRGGKRRVRTRRLRQAGSAVALSVVAALSFTLLQSDGKDAVQPTDKEPAELLDLLRQIPFSGELPGGVEINHLSYNPIEDGFGSASFSDIRHRANFDGGVVVIGYRVFTDDRDFFSEQTEDMANVPGRSIFELDLPYRNRCASFSEGPLPYCFIEVGDVLISVDSRLVTSPGGSPGQINELAQAAIAHLEFVSRIGDEGDVIRAIAEANGVTLSSGVMGVQEGHPDPTLAAFVQFLGDRKRVEDAWSFAATSPGLGWAQEPVSAIRVEGFRSEPAEGSPDLPLLVLVPRRGAPVALTAAPPLADFSFDDFAGGVGCPQLLPREPQDHSAARNAAQIYLERRYASMGNFSEASPEFTMTLRRNHAPVRTILGMCRTAQDRSWKVQGHYTYPPGAANPSASLGFAKVLLGKTRSGWVVWAEIH